MYINNLYKNDILVNQVHDFKNEYFIQINIFDSYGANGVNGKNSTINVDNMDNYEFYIMFYI